MAQTITLKRTKILNNQPSEEVRHLVIEMNIELAMRLKSSIGLDVYEPLDTEKGKSFIPKLIASRETVAKIAMCIFQTEPAIAEWMNADNLNTIRSAFLRELVDFSNPYSLEATMELLRESEAIAVELGERTARGISRILPELRSTILGKVPDPDEFLKEAKEALENYLQPTLGEGL
jgi:predicted CopG family antitoxin